jgi:hypothetical protein
MHLRMAHGQGGVSPGTPSPSKHREQERVETIHVRCIVAGLERAGAVGGHFVLCRPPAGHGLQDKVCRSVHTIGARTAGHPGRKSSPLVLSWGHSTPPWAVWTCSAILPQDCRACTQSLHSMGRVPGEPWGAWAPWATCSWLEKCATWTVAGARTTRATRAARASTPYTPDGPIPTVSCPCSLHAWPLLLRLCVPVCVAFSALPRVCPAMRAPCLPLCELPCRPSRAPHHIVPPSRVHWPCRCSGRCPPYGRYHSASLGRSSATS